MSCIDYMASDRRTQLINRKKLIDAVEILKCARDIEVGNETPFMIPYYFEELLLRKIAASYLFRDENNSTLPEELRRLANEYERAMEEVDDRKDYDYKWPKPLNFLPKKDRYTNITDVIDYRLSVLEKALLHGEVLLAMRSEILEAKQKIERKKHKQKQREIDVAAQVSLSLEGKL